MSNDIYPPYDRCKESTVKHARAMLEDVGIDLDTEHTRLTPYRIVHYLSYWMQRRELPHFTVFDNVEPKVDQLVVVSPIPFWSCCSHHMLPYMGVVHFGYIPTDSLVGLSKVPQIVQSLARQPSLQEHLTREIADWFEEELKPFGLGVITVARHTCQMLDLDGPSVPSMTFSELRGALFVNPTARAEFLDLIDMTGGTT